MRNILIGFVIMAAVVGGWLAHSWLTPEPPEVVMVDTTYYPLPPDTMWMPAIHDTIPQDTCWLVKIEKDTVYDTLYIEAQKGDEFAKATIYIDIPCSLSVCYYPKNDLFSFTRYARRKEIITQVLQGETPFVRFTADVGIGRAGADWEMGIGVSAVIRENWRVGVMGFPDGWLLTSGLRIGK